MLRSFLTRSLTFVESVGNRLPQPAALFMWAGALVLLLSWLLSQLGVSAQHPVTQELLQPVNLLSVHGLQRILSQSVTNFTSFAPVGVVLVAMLGLGVAEQSGLLGSVLRQLVAWAPDRLLTYVVVLAGVLSSLAADAGYVVLIPLAGSLFQAAGRSPAVGIAAAFAGVSGGFSANILIGPLDAALAGLSTEAAQLLNPAYQVDATGNYYFILASTALITLVAGFVTEAIVEPHYHKRLAPVSAQTSLAPDGQARALRATFILTLIFGAVILWGALPEQGFLRDPESGSLASGPLVKGSVVIIALYAALAGLVYGRSTGIFTKEKGVIAAMEGSMASMASYLVLMFFASQFVAWFGWTQLGLISAVKGADLLAGFKGQPTALLLTFIALAALVNLFIGSASAKWALLAPIFVPMFMLLGISPEGTQMAYRIGDSTTNIITPLMPYLPVVLTFIRRYYPSSGIGTLIAMMLPYSLALALAWAALLGTWLGLGLPLGPGAGFTYP